MKTSLVTFLFLATFISFSCNTKKAEKPIAQLGTIEVLSPVEFKEKSKNQTLIDIRTPQEYAQGYIEGAENINMFDKDFLERILKFDKEEPIFIYCRSGNRTSSASKKIVDLGFKQVYDLQGGINNWARANQKIVK